MTNKEKVESLIVCGSISVTKNRNLDVLNNTRINVGDWFKKCERFNISYDLMLEVLINLVSNHNDKNIEQLKIFEDYIEFIFGTFKNRRIYDSMPFDDYMTIWALAISSDFRLLNGVFKYNNDCGEIFSIDNRELRLDTVCDKVFDYDMLGIDLVLKDIHTSEVLYYDIIGIEKDFKTGKVTGISFDSDDDINKKALSGEEGKLKIVFFDENGRSLR